MQGRKAGGESDGQARGARPGAEVGRHQRLRLPLVQQLFEGIFLSAGGFEIEDQILDVEA